MKQVSNLFSWTDIFQYSGDLWEKYCCYSLIVVSSPNLKFMTVQIRTSYVRPLFAAYLNPSTGRPSFVHLQDSEVQSRDHFMKRYAICICLIGSLLFVWVYPLWILVILIIDIPICLCFWTIYFIYRWVSNSEHPSESCSQFSLPTLAPFITPMMSPLIEDVLSASSQQLGAIRSVIFLPSFLLSLLFFIPFYGCYMFLVVFLFTAKTIAVFVYGGCRSFTARKIQLQHCFYELPTTHPRFMAMCSLFIPAIQACAVTLCGNFLLIRFLSGSSHRSSMGVFGDRSFANYVHKIENIKEKFTLIWHMSW